MEEIDIIELLKRVKEGNAPKSIEINENEFKLKYSKKQSSTENVAIEELYITDDNDKWFDYTYIFMDTKIKILDKPIIEELEIDSGENTTQRIFEEKINEIIKWINNMCSLTYYFIFTKRTKESTV